MTIVGGDRLQVVAKFSAPFGSQFQNRWHYDVVASGGIADLVTVTAVAAGLDDIYSNLNPYVSLGVTFLTASIDVIGWLGTRWGVQYHVGDVGSLATWDPTAADHPLPAANSIAVSMRTDNPNRTGRKFFFGFTEAQNEDDGSPLAAAMLAALDACTEYVFVPLQLDPSSWLQAAIVDANAQESSTPQTCVVQNRWYVQRRRRPYIGV